MVHNWADPIFNYLIFVPLVISRAMKSNRVTFKIKDSIKPHKFEVDMYCLGQKINVNVIKIAHGRSTFFKNLVSKEI